MPNQPDLRGKVILLTGASKGIGAATARILGAAGADLIAHYGSDQAGAEAATAAIAPERKRLIKADLANLDEVEALWDAAVAWRGRVDVLVNNAAVMDFSGGIDAPLDVWDAVWAQALRVNVEAPARLVRRAIKHYLAEGGGTIISLSSWAAQRGVTNPATMAYGASKAAIRAMTQSVARAYARDRILAYIVSPGVVRTRLSEQFAATQGGEDKISATLASGEWVSPDELGALIAFLATGAVPQLSGATLDVNGASYIR
jgi:NAD(P)-dependent dehydrogenase (short-subunit alcohol dehydrogenase family)